MKKRIVFVGFTKIKYMPYMNFYLDSLKNNLEVHLIYWNRDNNTDQTLNKNIKLHCYEKEIDDSISLLKKMPSILGFSKFAKTELKKISPDLIIVMHSTTAITIYSLLTKKYREKYIFDYRDVTYEKFYFYRKIIGNIVKYSFVTFTSSDAFRRFLPNYKHKILTSHNILKSTIEKSESYSIKNKKNTKKTINIAFWGLIRHTEYNKIIIEKLGGDNRFQLHYYGRATGNDLTLLKESEKKYNNVFFHGEYLPDERDKFAVNTDIIHNLYNNSDATMPYAMANKFYDGLVYKIPQLCSKGSYMGNLCTLYGVGLECSPYDENFTDSILHYYEHLNYDEFCESCDNMLTKIMNDIKDGEEKINEFVK